METFILRHPSGRYVCAKCEKVIEANVIRVEGKDYHDKCLVGQGAGAIWLDDQIESPTKKRPCTVCNNLIQRNLIIYNGHNYHWGCLHSDEAPRPSFHCNSCGADLRRGQSSKTFVMGVPSRSCTLCGAVGTVVSMRSYAGSWGVVHPGGL